MDDLIYEIMTLINDSKELLLQFAHLLPSKSKLAVIKYASKSQQNQAQYPGSIDFRYQNRLKSQKKATHI